MYNYIFNKKPLIFAFPNSLASTGKWLGSYPRSRNYETLPAKSTKGQKVTSILLVGNCLVSRGWLQKGQEVKKSGWSLKEGN